MKHTLVLLVAMCYAFTTLSCPVCERNQPKLFRGLVHGAGPDSQWDYIIIVVTTIIVLVTLYFSVKWLIQPGEGANGHIKRRIFKNFQDE
ncbi:hypothetical protein [Sphingobacterium psychroaquaticum]|uniref:Uncharacterized protein n=1 Tax=Sphingobacterium psychroaquaticum TaxID=561061 RepID=A0A1X7IZY6_9SPHI|nr:hypothetical protein [Sphingobacterium psychroaquaticum]QBQ40307.1 hypothetical protein E2P86_03745 [Sphingobacterium psychroaquaticum]SMG20067.1 hypothetical protein SAMN05660862_1196 [Sphingobacterium psychroaquaticum]